MWPYLLQLKHFGFPSLKLLLPFPISMGCSHLPYVIPVPSLWSWHSSMDLYPCLTKVIVIFHFLSDSGAAMGGYPSIILMISCHTFFFSKKMACSSSVSVFIAKASNFIMKSTIFCFSCLKDSILHLASAAFVLLLNVVLIFLTNFFQSWVPGSLSNVI